MFFERKLPAYPTNAIPTKVTATAKRRISPFGEKRSPVINAGIKVPRAAVVPNATDCPSAIPKKRILRPKVSPPTPQSAP